MAQDRQLSRDFWLHEFSGWQGASELQADQLESFTLSVLQPTRDRWGRIQPTSWLTWSSGELRTGGHKWGAVDFVPLDAPIPAVHAWMGYTLPLSSFGELIDERNHIHVTPPGVGGQGEILVEYEEGRYAAVSPSAPYLPNGAVWEIPGFEVVVAGPRTWLAWILAGSLLLAMARRRA